MPLRLSPIVSEARFDALSPSFPAVISPRFVLVFNSRHAVMKNFVGFNPTFKQIKLENLTATQSKENFNQELSKKFAIMVEYSLGKVLSEIKHKKMPLHITFTKLVQYSSCSVEETVILLLNLSLRGKCVMPRHIA